MDIIRFRGGLGNQMFQYALFRALVCRGREVRGSLGGYRRNPKARKFELLDVFGNINIHFVDDDEFDIIDNKWKNIKQDKKRLLKFETDYKNRFFWVEKSNGVYDKNVFMTQNCVFVGYWQTEKYFKNIINEIKRDFTFSCGDRRFEQLKNKIINNKRYVSVHIRRGDYLEVMNLYGNLEVTQYYKKAMEYMESQINNPIYVYFSDDIKWVKENVNDKNGIFIEADMFDDYQDWYDMCLMSCCANNIIANSSFSWWGAWLNRNHDKIVIAPKRWLIGYDTPDIWCDGWIKM